MNLQKKICYGNILVSKIRLCKNAVSPVQCGSDDFSGVINSFNITQTRKESSSDKFLQMEMKD